MSKRPLDCDGPSAKRVRRASITSDNISLSLVLGFLGVRDVLSCRRTCTSWRAASFKPEAWLHISITLSTSQLVRVPEGSIVALQRLCLIRDVRVSDCGFDPTYTMQRLSQMPRLFALRLEEMIVNAPFCTLLSASVPQLRELDMTLCCDGWTPPVPEADEPMPDAPDDARSINDAARLAAAAPCPDTPVLRLPHLTALRTHPASVLRRLLSMVGDLPPLRVLKLARVVWKQGDLKLDEQYFAALLNRAFTSVYADSLCDLALSNMHYISFDCLRLASLPNLTRLSLTQHSDYGGVTRQLLRTIANDMPQLRKCEIRMGDSVALKVCDAEWWTALMAVRTLVAFGIKSAWLSSRRMAVISAGMVQLLGASGPHLQRLRVFSFKLASPAIEAARGHAHLRSVSMSASCVTAATVAALASMQQLSSLDLEAYTRPLPDAMVEHVANRLPGLRELALRNIGLMMGRLQPTSRAVLSRLTSMPRLRVLALTGFDPLGDGHVDDMCTHVSSSASALRHLTVSNSMLTTHQCQRLLQASAELRVVRHSAMQPPDESPRLAPRLAVREYDLCLDGIAESRKW